MKLQYRERAIDIFGLEGRYIITTMGRVWAYPNNANSMEGGFLIPNINPYLSVVLAGKKRYIHRLLAEAFIDNLDNKNEVNHIDGDKTNCTILNLEWVTSSENIQHAWDSGIRIVTDKMRESCSNISYKDRVKGSKKGGITRRKISEEVAQKIRDEYTPYKVSYRKLGEKYSLPATTVQYIIKHRYKEENK